MNFEKGLVSICIPTYNGASHIRETVDSVLSQTYKNFEIIVTDDGSTDNTLDILQEYKDDRIKIFKNEKNRGLPGNWSEAVKKAKGEFVKVLCQDDLLFENALERQVDALSDPEVLCVIGNSVVINGEGKTILKRKRFSKDVVLSGIKYAKKSLMGRNIYGEPPILLYRTELFYKYGEYCEDLKYTPDWEFAVRISLDGKISCLCENIMAFRVASGTETTRLSKEKMKFLVNDTDHFYDKFKDDGRLKLNKLNELFFKLVIRIIAQIRLVIILFTKN